MSVPEAADPHVGETRISLQLNEEEEAWQRGQNFVAVGSVKPAIATLDLHVISVPKAKKKPKKKSKK
ncbi:hypothetical protein MUP07_04760 [Candidatus Bathyarchaeota archaeon]|nr:hypothetical protein [Candidatus Bathyarchaeota archaeon]